MTDKKVDKPDWNEVINSLKSYYKTKLDEIQGIIDQAKEAGDKLKAAHEAELKKKDEEIAILKAENDHMKKASFDDVCEIQSLKEEIERLKAEKEQMQIYINTLSGALAIEIMLGNSEPPKV